jgi:hypothetical protein
MKKATLTLFFLALALAVCAPAGASTIYTNGPINGTNSYSFPDTPDNWAVADSFVSSGSANVTGFDAGIWVYSGDTPTTFTWTILTGGPSWLGGTTVASGNAIWSNVFWGTVWGGGYDVFTSTASGLNVGIEAGTYWLELSNGVTARSDDVLWDQNYGPSTAYHSLTGPIGSEAFTVYGDVVPLPGAIWLLGSGLVGLIGLRRKFKS